MLWAFRRGARLCDKQALITFENNHKNATGVCGDIKKPETKEKILKQIEFSS
ncbi:hypothetical protein MLS212_08580 [Helicobacter pylori]